MEARDIQEDQLYAILIGVCTYPGMNSLKPLLDVRKMNAYLKTMNFKTLMLENPDFQTLELAISSVL